MNKDKTQKGFTMGIDTPHNDTIILGYNYKEALMHFEPHNEQEENDRKIILEFIDKYGDTLLTRENEIAHLTSSGLILNESLTKILMIHHNIYNTWAWTGGHADGEPDMLKTAVKEAMEETGLKNIRPFSSKLASVDILPVYGHVKKGKYVSAHLHLNTTYALIADEDESLQVNEEETSGVMWVDVEKINEYSSEPYLIDIYLKIVDWARRVSRA